jgi:transcriptional regulator with XRE-family HTH domain
MGRSQRPRPARLASKLLRIRLTLGLTQQQMLNRLDYRKSPLLIGHISDFELDKREPSLPLLLAYARTSGVTLETLADDEVDLLANFQVRVDHPERRG